MEGHHCRHAESYQQPGNTGTNSGKKDSVILVQGEMLYQQAQDGG